MALTILDNLIDPEVIADFVDKKLIDKTVFAALAEVDYSLNGNPGSVLTFPVYNYIGAASVVGEGSEISLVSLTTSSASVAVHKIAQGVEISDEALLSAAGSPAEESADQLVKSLADATDIEMLGILNSIASEMTFTASTSTLGVDDVNDALELFGEDIADGTNILVCAPALYTKLRKVTGYVPASEIAAEMLVKGAVGEVFGCQVIVSNRLKNSAAKAFICKPGALRLVLKRDTLVEVDRDIIHKTTAMTADKHMACYLYNPAKAIKLAVTA